MDMSRISVREKYVSQYSDNKEAWERVCDLFKAKRDINMDDVNRCKTADDYFGEIYPDAVTAAEIVHVMATVPVYVMLVNDSDQDTVSLFAFTPEDNASPAIPVYFSREDAVAVAQKCSKATNKHVWSARIPFMLLVDHKFGLFPDWEANSWVLALCDTRENADWYAISRNDILVAMMDACRALRSYYHIDVLADCGAVLPGIDDAAEEWGLGDDRWTTESVKPPIS